VTEGFACRSCGVTNLSGQRFCGSCGAALTQPCAACGAPNPPEFTFCGSCGARLAHDAGPAAAPSAEERRIATVLFTDVSGFTALSERMDPEDVKALAHEVTGGMGEEIRRFGGTVVSVMGDAVMAVFGAPLAHEDDPERAVRAALSICDSVHVEVEGRRLELHIGINTGEVMAGMVGPESRRDYTVMGDVTNTAARLQGAAGAGEILVGRATHAATDHAIEYEKVPPVRAKGKDKPVPAFRAIRARSGPTERRTSAVPLVGRTTELELLERLWEQSATGRRPHLVTLSGPPGIGKSRLLREFQQRIPVGEVLRGRCLPYGETTGYDAFGQLVRQAAGILESDPVAEARDKLYAAAAALFLHEGATEVEAHLETFLGWSSAGAPDRQLLFASARRFVEAVAERSPTILAFEDIHWAQAPLLDLIEYLAARVREAPLMILTLARPELLDHRPTWGDGLPGYTAIPIDPLDDREARDLALALLAHHARTERAFDALLHTGGGNPLFLEELAASMTEQAPGVTAGLPTSVQAIIAARLDALPAGERRILQQASIFGRFFWRRALQAVTGDPAADEALDSLEGRAFIRPVASSRLAGDREFTFKHILTQEVAYSTLSRATRRTGHAAVARHLEEAMGERSRDSASLLAHHWKEAGELGRAADYLLVAAEIASRAWAKDQAIALYSEAADLLDQTGDPARRDEAWPRDRRSPEYAYLLGQLGQALYWRGHYELAEQAGREGFDIAMETSTLVSAMTSAADAGLALGGLSRHEEAIEWFERGVLLGRDFESTPRLTGRTLNMWAGVVRELGDVSSSRGMNEEALELGLRSSFGAAQVSAKIDLLVTDVLEGQVGSAERMLPQLMEAVEGTKGWHLWLWTSRLAEARARILLASGRPQEAAAAARESLRLALRSPRPKYACWSRIVLGRALLELGQAEEAEGHLTQAAADGERMAHAPSLWPSLGWRAVARDRLRDPSGADEDRERARRVLEGSRRPSRLTTLPRWPGAWPTPPWATSSRSEFGPVPWLRWTPTPLPFAPWPARRSGFASCGPSLRTAWKRAPRSRASRWASSSGPSSSDVAQTTTSSSSSREDGRSTGRSSGPTSGSSGSPCRTRTKPGPPPATSGERSPRSGRPGPGRSWRTRPWGAWARWPSAEAGGA
jgi:class 3 adenylate cyclase/tetratricopeptide (TPR) repeat protein